MRTLRDVLVRWEKRYFGSVKRHREELLGSIDRLKRVEVRSPLEHESIDLADLRHALIEIYKREEIVRRQRARCNWLRKGDANTAFFHKFTNMRRRINSIDSLDSDSGPIKGEITIQSHVFHHFKNCLVVINNTG